MAGCCLYSSSTAFGATFTWSGAANDGNWNNGVNWTPANVPLSGDTALIPGGLATTYPIISNNVTIASVTINSSGSDAVITVVSNAQFYASGLLTINASGHLSQSGGSMLLPGGLKVNGIVNQSGGLMRLAKSITVNPSGKLTISSGGSVSLSGGLLAVKDFDASAGAIVYQSGSSIFQVSHDYKNGGTFNSSGGSIQFTGNGGGKNWDTKTGGAIHRFYNVVIDAGVTVLFDGKTSPSIEVRGSWTNNGFSSLTGRLTTVTFSGTNDQYVGGRSITTFRDLIVDKGSGALFLRTNVIVGTAAAGIGNLVLQKGNVSTGSNTLTIAAGASVSRTGATPGHVIGRLRKFINTNGTVTRTFEVGTGTNYSPIHITLLGVGGAGTLNQTLTGSAVPGDHPALADSGINPVLSVNRHWSLSREGTWTFTSSSPTFHFVPGDLDPGASPSRMVVRYFSGSVWTSTVTGARSASSLQSSNVMAFGDFAAGETNSAATVATLTVSRTPACSNELVRFTARVTSSGMPVNQGYVRLIEGGTCSSPETILAESAALDTNGQASMLITSLSEGLHIITACFSNSAFFDASSVTITQSVSGGLSGNCQISGPDLVCSISTNVFSGPDGMEAYRWSVSGNGSISGSTNLQNVMVTSGGTGSFTLRLTMMDPGECGNECEKVVTVTGPGCLVEGPVSVCPASTNTYAGPPDMVSYSWSVAGDATIVGDATDSVVRVAAGECGSTYVLSLAITDDDHCPNKCSLDVVMEDSEPPLLTCPGNLVIECGEDADPDHTGYAEGTDGCGAAPRIGYVDDEGDGQCPWVIKRIWSATDACGNSTLATQIISMLDSTPDLSGIGHAFAGGVVIQWNSKSNRHYIIGCSTDSVFYSDFASNIPATPPVNSYTSSFQTNLSHMIYRLTLE